MRRAEFRRKCIQLASALLYNANFAGFASGTIYKGDPKGVCVPGLNCYSCPGAVAACPLGSLQNALSAMPDKLPLYILGILMLLGLTLGRLICGFLCPFGLIQELLHKIPGKKIKKGRWSRKLSWLKYAVLAVFVVAIPLWYAFTAGYPLPGFCKYICPAGTPGGSSPGRRACAPLFCSCAYSATGPSAAFSAPWGLSTPSSAGWPCWPSGWTRAGATAAVCAPASVGWT